MYCKSLTHWDGHILLRILHLLKKMGTMCLGVSVKISSLGLYLCRYALQISIQIVKPFIIP